MRTGELRSTVGNRSSKGSTKPLAQALIGVDEFCVIGQVSSARPFCISGG
jgi:hypothetical protein